MEAISDTKWDVLIAGTGILQSLLALALSRSDKKVLHVDAHGYYGGADAALSLQDAEDWVKQVNEGGSRSIFRDAHITQSEAADDGNASKLGFSRAYSLALSPQIIYTRTALLPALVSSKVYRQLEFLAVGSWFVYEDAGSELGTFRRIPSSREDVFADKSMDMKSKRSLMRFLNQLKDEEGQVTERKVHGMKALSEYLAVRFGMPVKVQEAVNALTLSPEPPSRTLVKYALPRLWRHLSSIGVFGPGFGAVIPKWGGLAEIAQVACRAQAVGGGIYMLGRAVQDMQLRPEDDSIAVMLGDGTKIDASYVVGARTDLPTGQAISDMPAQMSARSITIASSTMEELFMSSTEMAPKPAVAIVAFSAGSLEASNSRNLHPVYLMIHSSETGECPVGQCVIYGSTAYEGSQSRELLRCAVQTLLSAYRSSPESILSTLDFVRESPVESATAAPPKSHILSSTTTDLTWEDHLLQTVQGAWQDVTEEVDGFMQFDDREVGAYEDEE